MSFSVGDDARRPQAPELWDVLSPRATRAAVRRLRDPRMWIGVLLVATSAMIGARALAAADDTVDLWSAARDLPAGAQLSSSDVATMSAHFADAGTVDGYLPIDRALIGQQLAQPVRAGELIPAAAIEAVASPAAELPIGVASSDLPPDLAAGDHVDVWALPADQQSGDVTRIARDIRVVAVSRPELGSVGGDREVLVAVNSTREVAAALRGLAGARAVLVRIGG